MMKRILPTLLLLLGILAAQFQTAHALPRANVQDDQVTFDFPNTATFSATLNSNADITSVTLEYGDQEQTCGNVTAKAYPQFTPGKNINVEWTWDMRQSGSLPPGAQIWWRWRYTDSSGAEFISEQKSATWLDDIHDWQTITSGELNLHWYDNDKAFAQSMLDAGIEGLRRNKEQAGLVTDTPIHIYIYPNYDDLRAAVLYEASWTGGQAYPNFNIIIMGSTSDSTSDWNSTAVIHELTHVLVEHLAFSCISGTPGWLAEGLAMFSEGKLDDVMQNSLDTAIRRNELITLRSLGGEFSELSDKANLSYAQSYSVVNFLIKIYGQEKMTQLLGELRDAKTIDNALMDVYGFDTDGLEDAWRKSIDAEPRTASAQATAMPTPTFVPTYVPVSGSSFAVTPTPYAVPTSSFDGSNHSPTPTANPTTDTNPSPWSDPNFLFLTAILGCVCCLMILLVGIFVLGFALRKNNAKSKGGDHA